VQVVRLRDVLHLDAVEEHHHEQRLAIDAVEGLGEVEEARVERHAALERLVDEEPEHRALVAAAAAWEEGGLHLRDAARVSRCSWSAGRRAPWP
jgi:hypothetical protein